MMKLVLGVDNCRVCLRISKKSHSIYEALEDGEETPCEMIEMITAQSLVNEEENRLTPEQICQNCELSLKVAFRFRNKVLKAQHIIDMHYKQKQASATLNVKRKNATVIKKDEQGNNFTNETDEVDMDGKNEGEDEYIENIVSDENDLGSPLNDEVEQLEENEEFVDKNEEYLEVFELEYLYDGEDLNMSTIERIDEDEQDMHIIESEKDTADIPIYVEDSEVESEMGSVLTDVEICNLELAQAKSQKNDAKTCNTQKTTRSKKNEDMQEERTVKKEYICDICGNAFEKRGRMMEHRQRHDKELRYACEICDERFHLREHMRRHMFLHRGHRPYQCSYCSRSFYYESVRKSHELVHNGAKPFVCKVCNKAFAYAHALKKHQMIHDDVKLFRCEFCKKEFRLQHHMKQHQETKMHRNAVALAFENDNDILDKNFIFTKMKKRK